MTPFFIGSRKKGTPSSPRLRNPDELKNIPDDYLLLPHSSSFQPASQKSSKPSSQLSTTDRWKLVLLFIILSILAILIWNSRPAHARSCTDLTALHEDAWQAVSQGGYPLVSDFLTRSGTAGMYLGGINGADDQVRTQIHLGDAPARLSFSWQIHTQEDLEEGYGSRDILAMTIRTTAQSKKDANSEVVEIPLLMLSAADATYVWQTQEVDLSAFRGQPVEIGFRAVTDNQLVTDFFVDDIAVTSCGSEANNNFRVFLPYTSR